MLLALLFGGYGVYQGIFRAVGRALAADVMPEHLRASGPGWYTTTIGVLGLVASLVAGFLWDQVGHAAVFLYGAAFALVGSVVLLRLAPAAYLKHNTPAER
jgi:MFS family permease